jgi:tetratricopeptide (TPR) repeat protein
MNPAWTALLTLLILGQAPVSEKSPEKSAEKAIETMLETRRLSAQLDEAFRYQRRLVIPGLLAELKKTAPDSAVLHYFVGLDFLNRGERIQALLSLRQAISSDNSFTPALSAAALILAEAGKEEEALALLDIAIVQSPHDPTYLTNAGICRWRLGLKKEAMEYFDRALVARNSSGEAHLYKGRYLSEIGQLAEAQTALGLAIRYGVRDSWVYGEFLRLSHKTGRHEDSLAALQQLEKDGRTSFLRVAAQWYVRYGSDIKGRAVLDRAFAQGGTNAADRLLYARILARAGGEENWLRTLRVDDKERAELERILTPDVQAPEFELKDPVVRPSR